ncbi:UL36 very large tegument protein [Streptomyces sp. NPDC001970]
MEVGVFARYLRELADRLDRGGGWYAVFWQRDPGGLVACLQGAEIPPWDVVESLLQDLPADGGETVRARALHSAAAAAHDRMSGGPDALQERLDLMRREQAYAADRGQELLRQLSALPERSPEYQRLAHELSWTNDDHTRATARCTELSARLAALGDWASGHPDGDVWTPPADRRPGPAGASPGARPPNPGRQDPASAAEVSPQAFSEAAPEVSPQAFSEAAPDAAPEAPAHGPAESSRSTRRSTKRRPRGARYAWGDGGDDEAVAVPDLPAAGIRPRGARFGGADAGAAVEPEAAHERQGEEVARARRAAAETVAALVRLRAEGRGGEAHAQLCEAAVRPAAWLPVLAAELHRAGLGADWATLLWEAASLPPGRLAAAAGALAAAGRAEDCGQLLRQGVARPAAEIADAVLALGEAGDRAEADALLTAFVRARTPEDSAQLTAPDPRRLVPQLLVAARAVSPERERDVVHALRVAGIVSG